MIGIVKKDAVKKKEEETKETWWKRLTVRKRSLTLFTTISITIGISTLIALVYVVHYMKPEITLIEDIQFKYEKPLGTVDKQEDICTSAECIHTASRILKYIDKNIDPCNNFYHFACGNYVKYVNQSKYSIEFDSFANVETMVQEQLINMVEETIQNDEAHPFQLIKKFYQVCVKGLTDIESLEVMKIILYNLGGWPVLDGVVWAESDFNWNNFDHKLARIGYGSSYYLNLVIDSNSTNTIYVGKPVMPMRDLSNETLNALYNYMVDFAVLLGAHEERATMELNESIEFELKLSDNTMSEEKYTTMNIEQLETNFPSIPWREYMADLSVPDTHLANMVFYVNENYITKFKNIIDTTPQRVQANYLMWRVIADSLQYLNEYINRGNPGYVPSTDEKWRKCMDQTKLRFPVAFGAMYVSKYFNKYSKQATREIVADIKTELYEILKKVDWMDEVTRGYAFEKADALVANIGYPDELMDIANLEEYYKGLVIHTDNYLLSILEVDKFTKRNFYNDLKQTVDETYRKRESETYSTYAYYSFYDNSIELPAGSLQGVFFDVQRPKYMNYGAIGYIIAANIIGGFNEEGSRYDKNGYNMGNWWQNQTRTLFKEKAQCIFDLYIKPEYPYIYINEPLIYDILFGNNGGIKIAYLAYRHWLERNREEPKLPGVDFTPLQMFWISAANMWCPKYDMIYRDIGYSIEEFRVSNLISQSEYFAKDFNCPKGSPMYPSKSCQVW